MKKSFLLLWLLLCGSIGLAVAQNRQVQGLVKSTDGEALPGVTVLVKGTTNGATTGPDGNYSISLPEGGSPTLVFSFIGFATKEVAVGSQATVNATLTVDSKELDDVVVIGYQEVQRRDVTGSVSSVSAQQIKDIPVNSAAEALTGRLAGVQLTSAEGTPGNQDVQVRVRGGGSVTQDNSPLYIVDGVQVENALSVLSPQDIASVDVLKDASSTAIYGARGANGVIIITTKGGREGRVIVSYNGFAGFRQLTKKLDVMKPGQYVDWQYERAAGIGNGPGGINTFRNFFGNTNYLSDTLDRSRNAPFIDWQDEVFGRNAFQQTHNLSISGGAKGTTYSLSLTRNNEDGIQIGSNYTRNLVNLRLDNKASDKFRLGVNVRFNDQKTMGAGTGTSSQTGTNTTSRLRNTVQYQPLSVPIDGAFDPNAFDDDFFSNSSLINPVLVIGDEYKADKRRTLNLSGNASYNIAKNLTFRSTLGFDLTNTSLETFNGFYSPAIRQASGPYNTLPFAGITTGTQTTINNSNVLTYKLIKGQHTVDALLGHEIYQQENRAQAIVTAFLPLNITPERALANINQGVLPPGVSQQPFLPTTSVPQNYRLLSGFARVNYAFADKYLITATMRADGSSKFREGQRVGYFPGLAAAWRVSQESFLKDNSKISDLKLRVSYGLAGNNRIRDFLFSQNFSVGSIPDPNSTDPTRTIPVGYSLNHLNVVGVAATSLPNPNLKWETTVSRNLGVDISLFSNRLQFTADLYYNTTRDLLLNVPIPPLLGYSSQQVNVGSTSNRGLELQAITTVLQNENFNWTATANTSFNRNRIESLGPVNELKGINSGWAGNVIPQDYQVVVGQPVGQMYGYITEGFYTADQFESYDASTRTGVLKPGIASNAGVIGQNVAPGIIRLRDVNGDGVVNADDRTLIGNANPKFTGGLNQQFSYKNFDASLFLNWVYGNDIYNANKVEFTTANYALGNLLEIMDGRYRTIDAQGQPLTTLQALNDANQNATIWQPTRQYFAHSWAIEDGSFLRINNLTLGYSLPKSLIQRAKLSQLRFYVTANNLYTFTKYTGYDPEVNTRRSSPLTPGVDYAAYPRSRAFLFGVNLSL
ncbi:TonB-dependent receptor [Hymenobacter sp. ASUV-10]|uniref:TonB-dependent receptor n=1 Tax=Hymenobacter aranciens TaxID=3063996 RepID=A0ABT9B886_9BACT|nr:TonB-dependent receptor [Hymenobacter sp. ASUV-10]MDO7874470.1 TonB-dependent receptor [Hymenobacter sp. ASUV-10]